MVSACMRPYAYAATGLAAFISPLIFGAMADRHASPVKVLRGLAFATAIMIAVVSTAIRAGCGPWVVLALIQIYSLCASPLTSISSTIIFARLGGFAEGVRADSWHVYVGAGWFGLLDFVSALNADQSTVVRVISGRSMWLVVVGFTFFLPPLETPKAVAQLDPASTPRLGRTGTVEKSRSSGGLHDRGIAGDSAGGVLSVFAAAHARTGASTYERVDDARPGNGDDLHVQPGRAADEMAAEMDFSGGTWLQRPA